MKILSTVTLNKDLKIGGKYTLTNTSDLLPYSVTFTLVDYSYGKHAQYENCLKLTVRQKHHRKTYDLWITPTDVVLIQQGWNHIVAWNKEQIGKHECELHKVDLSQHESDETTILYKPYGYDIISRIQSKTNGEVNALLESGEVEINIDDLLVMDDIAFN